MNYLFALISILAVTVSGGCGGERVTIASQMADDRRWIRALAEPKTRPAKDQRIARFAALKL